MQCDGLAAPAAVGGVQLQSQLQPGRQLRHREVGERPGEVPQQLLAGLVEQLGHKILRQAAVEPGAALHLQRVRRLVDDAAVAQRVRPTWRPSGSRCAVTDSELYGSGRIMHIAHVPSAY